MGLKTIEKALMVFKCFAESDSPLKTTDLAATLGTNKATMSRILSTLRMHDFLEQDADTRRYRLGPAMAHMARAFSRAMNGEVVGIAKPFADELRDKIDETVHIEVVYGNKIYLAYAAVTKKPISLTVDEGDLVAPNAHAGAKAIVAFSDSDKRERWLTNTDHPALTENTATDPDELREIMDKVRQTGIAYDMEEYLEGINAIGAPVFNHEDVPVASIIIVVPSYRMGKNWKKKFTEELKKSANKISKRLHSSRSV